MIKLSACVIVKNEEQNIVTWMEHMRPIVQEMIVVDTGSTDHTVELAKKGGAHTYFYAWQDDFAAAKNFALSKAKGDWILFLDADEYFSETSMDRVYSEIKKYDGDKRVDGIACYLTNIDADMDNRIISTAYQLRIFRNRKYIRYVSKIHEYLANMMHKTFTNVFVDLDICHTGYSPKILKDKLRRNLHMLQAAIAEKGMQPTDYGYLIDCYYGLQDYDKAIEYAEKSFLQETPNKEQMSTVYRRWIDALRHGRKKPEESMRVIDKAIDAFPGLPEFVFNKAEQYQMMSDYVAAEKYIRQALDLHEKNQGQTEIVKNSFLGMLPYLYYKFATLLRMKGEVSEALDMLVKSIKMFRYHQIVFQELYDLLKDLPTVEVIEFLTTLYEDNERDNKFLYECLRQKRNALTLFYEKRYKGKLDCQDSEHAMAAGKYMIAVTYLEDELNGLYSMAAACAIKIAGQEQTERTDGQEMELFPELELLLPMQQKERYHQLLAEGKKW